MSQNGHTLQIFQQMLQDFQNVSDHFGTLCIKVLETSEGRYCYTFEKVWKPKPCFYRWLWTYSLYCSGVSIVDLEQVHIFWKVNPYRKLTAAKYEYRSSHPEVFLRKGVLEICCKFTGEHPYQSVISIKLLCNFIEVALWHGCFPVNLLHILRTPFIKRTPLGGCFCK